MWMFGGGSAQAVLKIIILMVLSRLLTPTDFGVVAAALTVVALAEVFGKIGVAPSIVQVETLTDEHIRTGNLTTLVSGILVGGIVFLLAHPLGRLYAIDELPLIIQVFSVIFVIRAVGLVPEALIQRELGFRNLAIILVFSYLLGYAAVAIVLAWFGWGVWALVIAQMVQAVLQSAMSIHMAGYRVGMGYDGTKFRQMLRFGLGTTLTQIGNYAALNVDYLIVGRMMGAAPLGLYSRAYLLLSQPANIVGNMADKVLFPVLSSVQKDLPRIERAYNTTLGLTAITQVPLSALLCIYGPEVVAVLMGDQWGAAVVPFQIMVCALFFRTAYKFTSTVLRAMGKVYHAAALQWIYAAMVAIGAIVGVRYGLAGVAVGTSIAVVLCFFNGTLMLSRVFGLSAARGQIAILRHGVWALAFAVPLYALRVLLVETWEWPALPTLIAGSVAISVLFALVAIVAPRALGPERDPLFSVFKRMLGKS